VKDRPKHETASANQSLEKQGTGENERAHMPLLIERYEEKDDRLQQKRRCKRVCETFACR
jgi:hypothetical protein